MIRYKSTNLFLFSNAAIFEKLLFGGRQFILETASSRFTVLQLGTHFRALLLKSVKKRMGGGERRRIESGIGATFIKVVREGDGLK